MAEVVCALCGDPVEQPERAYRKVVGWERRRSGGGTNAIALRAPLDEYAHTSCVDLASAGHLGQGSLL